MSILKLTSDTLAGTPAAGNIEYNGQFFATDSNASRAQMQRFVQETAKTASGTSVDFTGIPAWAKKITVMLSGVSTSGTANYFVQIGNGSVITTGYVGCLSQGTTSANFSSGFSVVQPAVAATNYYGSITLVNITGNTWVETGLVGNNGASYPVFLSGGSLALSGTLDRVRITTSNGTDTFDAGSINIIYEG